MHEKHSIYINTAAQLMSGKRDIQLPDLEAEGTMRFQLYTFCTIFPTNSHDLYPTHG
jgi:hypothetical protein